MKKILDASLERDTLLMGAVGQVMNEGRSVTIHNIYAAAGIEAPSKSALGRVQELRDLIPIASSEIINSVRQTAGLSANDSVIIRPIAQRILRVDRFGRRRTGR